MTSNAIKNDTHVVKTYLTNYEYRKLIANAHKNNLSISKYIKLVLTINEKTDVNQYVNDEEMSKVDYHNLIVQLKKIGTNLNQIARNSNKGLNIDVDLRNWLDENIDVIKKALRDVSD